MTNDSQITELSATELSATELQVTELQSKIIEQIKLHGFINIYDYMNICLYDNKYGYYTCRQPLTFFEEKNNTQKNHKTQTQTHNDHAHNTKKDHVQKNKGDFITSPEISQIFGELLGIYLLQLISNNYRKDEAINLVELGPGSGKLLSDILCVLNKYKFLLPDINIYLLEVNRPLIKIQQELFGTSNFKITWITKLPEIPLRPTVFYGNEFLDCFAINSFIFKNNIWHELVIINNNNKLQYDYKEIDPSIFPNFFQNLLQTKSIKENYVIEYQPDFKEFIKELSPFFQRKSFAIFCDYGNYTYDFKPTLQAIQNHQKISPLLNAGKCDITAHVNFSYLQNLCEQNICTQNLCTQNLNNNCQNTKDNKHAIYFHNIISQEDFLTRMGGKLRLSELIKKNPTYQGILTRQYERISHPQQMGRLCKFCALSSQNIKLSVFDY